MPDIAAHHRSVLGRATIGDQLRRHARTQPDKTAFISYGSDGERLVLTYGELDARANQFANLLIELGVQHGDRVASMARNSVDVVVAYQLKVASTSRLAVLSVLARTHRTCT